MGGSAWLWRAGKVHDARIGEKEPFLAATTVKSEVEKFNLISDDFGQIFLRE